MGLHVRESKLVRVVRSTVREDHTLGCRGQEERHSQPLARKGVERDPAVLTQQARKIAAPMHSLGVVGVTIGLTVFVVLEEMYRPLIREDGER